MKDQKISLDNIEIKRNSYLQGVWTKDPDSGDPNEP